MIQKQTVKKGSVRKAQEKIEREAVLSPNKELVSLLGRVGAFYCEQCSDLSTHRIGAGFTQCIKCNTIVKFKENLLKGERKINKLEEIMIF